MIRGRRIQRYVARELLFSFFVAFLFFFFIFFINQILLLAEDILEKQVPVWDVIMLLIYSLPSIVALAFPFGSLLGCLMAFGRLSSDNEIVAMRSSGVSIRRIFVPVLIVGLSLTSVSFVMNDYFLPVGNLNLIRRYRELVLSNPNLEFEPYTVREFQDLVLVSGDVSDGTIENLLVIETDRRARERIISAGTATLREDAASSGILTLQMASVFLQDPVGGNEDDYDYSTSDRMEYNILLRDIAFSIQNPTAREMSSIDVLAMVRQQEQDLASRRVEQRRVHDDAYAALVHRYDRASDRIASGDVSVEQARSGVESVWDRYVAERDRRIYSRTLQVNRIEFHKKFSIPAACLSFIVFAFPVGLKTRRSGRAIGFGIGLLVSFLYWGAIFVGQTVGIQHPEIPAFLTMWTPNILLLLGGAAAFAFGRLG